MRSQSFELHPASSDRQALGRTTPGDALAARFACRPRGRRHASQSEVGAASETGWQVSGRRVT